MKKVIFILFCLLANISTAQQALKKFKGARMEYNQDSSVVLLTKGKKAALYDLLRENYVVKPSKAIIIPSFYRDWYLILDKKEAIVYEHPQNKKVHASAYNDLIGGYAFQRLDQERVLIQDYGVTITDPDKFDKTRLVQIGHQNSGVFNLKSGEWEVPNCYERIDQINDKLVGRKNDSIWVDVPVDPEDFFGTTIQYDVSYDVYEKSTTGFQVSAKKIKENTTGIKAVYDDKVHSVQGDFLILEDEGNWGIQKYNMFQLTYKDYPYLDTETIVSSNQKFVHLGIDEKFIAYQSEDDSVHVLLFDPNEVKFDEIGVGKNSVFASCNADYLGNYLIDGELYIPDKIETRMRDEYNFGIQVLSDNRYKIINTLVMHPQEIYDDFGESSFDGDSEYVYENNAEVIQKSGIYNGLLNQWELDSVYFDVYSLTNDVYVAEKAIGFEGELTGVLKTSYHWLDTNQSILQSVNNAYELWENDAFLKALNGGTEEVILDEGPGLINYEGNQERSYNHFIIANGEMKGFIENYDDTEFYEKFQADFVYRNERFPYTITLKNNEWMFYFKGDSAKITSLDYPIKILSSVDASCYQVLSTSENGDTLLFLEQLQEECKLDFNCQMSIAMNSDSEIVIADVHRDKLTYYDWFIDFEYDAVLDYSGSAIWRKDTANNWLRVTPYYANLIPIPTGYIAKTARFDGAFIYEEGIEGPALIDAYGDPVRQNVKEERSIWLNDNLKAKTFLDYYDFPRIEDLGFGVKVCTDKGCMLVTYSGIPLTEDVWEHFKIENEKIVGYRNEAIAYNEFGEPVEFIGVAQVFQALSLDDLKK